MLQKILANDAIEQLALGPLTLDHLTVGRTYTFRRVVLPLIRPALLAGAGLAWARALGELGATITFAGNFPGTTETTPIAVYIAAENDLDSAVSLAVVLLAVSFAVLLALRIGRSRIQERL